jgi:hypothetical protein
MSRYTSLSYWLPKIPLLSLIGIFLLPLILMQVQYETGLFFIALYISYWSVKVFEGYFYVLKSYLKLLRIEKRDFANSTLIEKNGKNLKHIVILPIYTEPYDVIEEAVVSLLANDYSYMENVTILLATESRAEDAEMHAKKITETYGKSIHIVNIVHPE